MVVAQRQNTAEYLPSWWQRLGYSVRSAFTRPAITNRLRKAERAVEATYLDRPQAEANQLQANGAASVIGSLSTANNACVQVGSLLVVKATAADGTSVVVARTLTQMELDDLSKNQTVLKDPATILEFLQSTKAKLE